MAKNSIAAYGAEGKSNVLFFDPDKLTLVTDKTHVLYDERVHLPLKEAMVLNIMALGVIQPITITKDSETGETLVVAGRQRVKHAREANRRLRERGEETIQVPAVPRRSDADGLAGVMVSENELREADTPIGRAKKMSRLAERGRSEAALAILFGCTIPTVRQTLALLDMPSAVRTAVDAGQITLKAAHTIAKLPAPEATAKVAELVKAGEGTTGRAKVQAQRAVVGDDKPRVRPIREIRAQMATTKHPVTAAALAWVLGEREGLE